MTAKRVRISSDNGVTWNTLPGNSASLSNELGEISDTIFGQAWASIQPGLNGWQISSNALYKGFAGYVATLKQISGASTSTTGEAFTLVTGKTYQINTASKQIWDRAATLVIYDNASPVAAADIESIDYLFGKVTFAASYSPTTPITADLSYFGTATIAKGRSFSLTQTAAEIDDTDFETAQGNNGHRIFDPGLRTVSLDIGGIYATANGFLTQLLTRAETIIELSPDGGGDAMARGFFILASQLQEGDVGALETESLTFSLYVPDEDDLAYPFHWEFAGSATLNQSVIDCIESWQDATEIDAQYLWDGTNGFSGGIIVTEVSLSGGLEVMNEFSVSLRGTGATTAVP